MPNSLQLDWTDATWGLIQTAVHDEASRTRLGRSFLPLQTPPDAATVNTETIHPSGSGEDLGLELRSHPVEIVELAVTVFLTQQEVNEPDVHSAIALVSYAANLLAHAEDLVMFQGGDGVRHSAIFPTVRIQAGNPGPGLLDVPGIHRVSVGRDPEQAFTGTIYQHVAEACVFLQTKHAGRLALILPTQVFGDTFAPLPGSSSTPRDRITAFVGERFYASSALPPDRGLLLAIDGNTMDVVVTSDAAATFLQIDRRGRFGLSVGERFALRLKDHAAVVRLEFEEASPDRQMTTGRSDVAVREGRSHAEARSGPTHDVAR